MALALLAACGSTEPRVDPATAPVAGTYTMTASALTCGCTLFTPGDVTAFTSDEFVLAGGDAGTWTRSYTTLTTSPDDTKRTDSGTASGTYERTGTSIVFRYPGLSQPDFNAQFTGSGMTRVEGDYRLTYAKR